jgi:hypothetical protein
MNNYHQPNRHHIDTTDSDIATALTYVRAVQLRLKTDRRRAFASLQDLFRDGEPPEQPLDGRYAGQLLAFDIAPGLTKLADSIAAQWRFWMGKTFDAPQRTGDDIYLRTLLHRTRVFWPTYRNYIDDTPQTWRVFPFRTTLTPSIVNTSLPVLRLDYDLPVNPRLSVARTMDEIVQLADGVYLGRAFVHWWWGRWQPVAYFVLRPAVGEMEVSGDG